MKIKIREPQLLTFEEFENLSIEDKLLILPLMPPKKRFDFLTDSKDAIALVRASPVIDLMVTIKEIGLDGAGPLLALCNSEQLQYFLDMDAWSGYSFDKEKMHRYLMILREWDIDVFKDKFCGLDYEQQLIYLLGDFKVFLVRDDFDPDEGAPENSFTIDGMYYLQPLCDEEKFLLTKELLMLVFENDKDLYLRLVEGMRQELYSVLEDELYRFRNSRITELGFYEYDDAIGVYSEPTNIKRTIIPSRIDEFSYSRLPIRYIHDIEPIKSELELIDERCAMEILFELQVLVNRLIIADKLEMFEIESLETSSKKVKSLLRLGLDVIKSELNIEPLQAVKQFYVIDIFRHGYKKLKSLRDEAKRIKSIHQYLKFVELPPYFEVLMKITQKNFVEINMREIFSDATSEYPESLVEIQKLQDLLLELEASLDILIKCYEVRIEDIEQFDHTHTNIPSDSKPPLYNLLMTPIINSFLGHGLRFVPIEKMDIISVYKKIFVESRGEILLSDEFLKSIEENIFLKLKESSNRYLYARRIIGRVLEEFISELGHIQDIHQLNPDFISVITIKKKRFLLTIE
ncbi:MAG: DUF6178 family protein [Deltaproteobacteria bacterium]|nr:DUF6178 family protein [Deltaproteobacteria bacterium]